MISSNLYTLIALLRLKAGLISIFLLYHASLIHAQPPPCGNPAVMSSFCRDACIICDIDGYTGRNGSGSRGEVPPGFCTTIVHNAKWIAFIAGSVDLRIRMSVSNCTQNRGLELGIYEGIDCENYRLVSNCRGGATNPVNNNTSAEFFNTEPLTIGQYYFLVMDGSNGTVCNWTLEVISGSTKVPGLTSSGSISGPDEVCINVPVAYETIHQTGATIYAWTIDGVSQTDINSKTNLTFTQAGTHEICVESANACDKAPPVCKTITVHPEVKLNPVISDYNGFTISCNGLSDGFITAGAGGSTGPFQFLWSNGETTESLHGLSAGTYSLSVTDANNCVYNQQFVLNEPDILTFIPVITDAGCSGTENGRILIDDLAGGVAPFTYYLNFEPVDSLDIDSLVAGTYSIRVVDANNCGFTEVATINQLPVLLVDAGADSQIYLGDSLLLGGSISGTYRELFWQPEPAVRCPTCLETWINPLNSGFYRLTAISDDGCMVSDSVWINVMNRYRIFVPEAFSPNKDNINDILSIAAGKELMEINYFRIYSRWGELLFEATNFQANTDIGWDGHFKGELMDQGVFTWSLEAKFIDGTIKSLRGESTLLK